MKLEAQNVTFAYKDHKPVLKEVSLQLETGQILYLLGHNGSGKTTLLSCLSGILTPSAGRITLDGDDLSHYSPGERARRIGLIPQLHVPAFAYTVRDMVLMGRAPHLGLFGRPGKDDDAITDHALEQLGLIDLRDRVYTQLSGGERQLVMIARGLAQQCDFLLMDEPDAHLDPSNHHRILEVVAGLTGQNLSFVIASHAPNSALMYADQVLLLRKGETLAYGSVDETLTESLLTAAYGMETEVIYKSANGRRAPRAIVPRRDAIPEGVEVVSMRPESLGNPDSQLEQIFQAGEKSPQLLIVTGVSGSGKSSWCADLIRQAQRRGLTVGGVLSPSVVRQGTKTGIDLLNLNSGQRRRLAKLRDPEQTETTIGYWVFDAEVVAWGNDALAQTPPCDLLVVDELGPLEFHRNKGFMAGFDVIARRQYKVALVIIRPSLMPEALERWPDAYVVDVDDG